MHYGSLWFLFTSETRWVSANDFHQAVWDCSHDGVWTRFDRWSRWGMNSCRRGLADRTWSVTRLLWRDRYTLSCQRGNKYTIIHHRVTMKHRPTHFIHILSSLAFELVPPFISFQAIFLRHGLLKKDLVTSLPVASVEQRPKEQIVSSRRLPEVQQREPGIPAGGPNTGAGGEARRGGKVRRRPQVGSQD